MVKSECGLANNELGILLYKIVYGTVDGIVSQWTTPG
jgi:hypothetical protein